MAEALQVAEDKGVEDLLPFATSAVREAPNGEHVLDESPTRRASTCEVLSGEDEARLTFLAARRWFGWSVGRLLVFDIGGGSLEIACGHRRGARRRRLAAARRRPAHPDWLPADPPDTADVRALRRHVRAEIARAVGEFSRFNAPDRVVGTSKTFKQLARIAGAARTAEGPYVERKLTRESLEE